MEIRIDQILFQILNFVILLFVFKKFLYAPILRMLDTRAAKVKEGMEAAEKNLKIQENLEEKKKQQLADAKKEANKILLDARREADAILRQANEKAKEEARTAMDREREAFSAEADAYRKDLRQEFVGAVTSATNAVLRGSVDKKLQESIIEEQIKSLDIQFAKNT